MTLDSGIELYPYKCEKCGYTLTYDKPQAEYENGFICGACLGEEGVEHEQSSK